MRFGILLFVWGTITVCASAQSPEDLFDEGNVHYREGRFREAVAAYEGVIKQGYVSAPLYFNLGNAQYRLGNNAGAILAYERSLRLDPGDADVEFNLKLANLRTIDRIDAVPELSLVTWLKALAAISPLHVTKGILIAAWVALFAALSILNLVPGTSFERALRLGVIVCVVVVVPVGGLFVLQRYEADDQSKAIVMVPIVTAKVSPDEQSLDAFVMHAGLKVQVGDLVGEWVRITLADGKVGWIQRSSCELI
ncbi:MAG: tetratricopeptide repeat protein [Bacteroidota bacterium]